MEQTVQAGCVGAGQDRIWRHCPSLGIWEWLDANGYKQWMASAKDKAGSSGLRDESLESGAGWLEIVNTM